MSQSPGTATSGGRRSQVLRVLRAASQPLGIAAVAAELGVHPNTVRFHLEALLRHGQVEQVAADRGRPGRPASLFRAVRRMDPVGARRYLLLADVLSATVAAGPDPDTRAAEAGRSLGGRLARGSEEVEDEVGALVDLLDELDFAPELQEAEAGPRIALRSCPFLELAESRSQVICPIHLGLMQGALEAWGSEVTVTGLEAFAEPDLCLAHLGAHLSPTC